MTLYVVEMRVPIIVDTDDETELHRVRGELRERAASFGWEPRFLTAEEWRWKDQFSKPQPFNGSRGRPESEHVRRSK